MVQCVDITTCDTCGFKQSVRQFFCYSWTFLFSNKGMREVKAYTNQILHFLAEVMSTRKQSESQMSQKASPFEC